MPPRNKAVESMKELPVHIQLHLENDKTLYEQIYEQIRDEIRSGNLLRDEKLPSARFLSEYLQVSRTTVDMAYGQLVSEGYVEARARKGYFVSAYEELYAIGASAAPREEKTADGSDGRSFARYDFSPTAIDMRYFPYATWKKITKNILVDANSKMFSLGEPQGDLELRTTIFCPIRSSLEQGMITCFFYWKRSWDAASMWRWKIRLIPGHTGSSARAVIRCR